MFRLLEIKTFFFSVPLFRSGQISFHEIDMKRVGGGALFFILILLVSVDPAGVRGEWAVQGRGRRRGETAAPSGRC